MSSILFLDVDGVLNSRATRPANPSRLRDWLDPINVGAFNELTRRAQFEVVLSTSWRLGRTLDEIAIEFAASGLLRKPIASTPDLRGVQGSRGAEIAAWLSSQRCPIQRFAILDDAFAIEEFPQQHVRISSLNGLRLDDLPAILRLLA